MVWDEISIADHRDRFFDTFRGCTKADRRPTCTCCDERPSLGRFDGVTSTDDEEDHWCEECAKTEGIEASCHYFVWVNGTYHGTLFWHEDTEENILAELRKRHNGEIKIKFAWYCGEDD